MLRRNTDAGLWYNMPGCVAVWQPIVAPGPLLARYNMAHGGDNRYRATDGVAPTWLGATGWAFDGATQYLNTGVVPAAAAWSFAIRFTASGGTWASIGVVADAGGYVTGFRRLGFGSATFYNYGGSRAISTYSTQVAVAGTNCYRQGVFDGALVPVAAVYSRPFFLGADNNAGAPQNYLTGTIQAVALYSRTLSAAEALVASRQMQYCDVNPDWSVWARRRRWFYAAAATGKAFWPLIHQMRGGSEPGTHGGML